MARTRKKRVQEKSKSENDFRDVKSESNDIVESEDHDSNEDNVAQSGPCSPEIRCKLLNLKVKFGLFTGGSSGLVLWSRGKSCCRRKIKGESHRS